MELDGVSSEEIFDESPCFIVPDSQASESASEKNTGKTAVVLEGLKLLQPSKSFDQIGKDFYVIIMSTMASTIV
jgi:hypothetical protein